MSEPSKSPRLRDIEQFEAELWRAWDEYAIPQPVFVPAAADLAPMQSQSIESPSAHSPDPIAP